MKRAPSSLLLIGGFGVAVTTLSVAATAAVVLLAPQPPAFRMSTAEAIAALRVEAPGYVRRIVSAPPHGTRAPLIEQMVAAELRLSPADVRAVWLTGSQPQVLGPATPGSRVPVIQLKQSPNNKPSVTPSFVVVAQPVGALSVVAAPALSTNMRRTFVDVPMPDFAASVRGEDGRWLSVEPARPLLQTWQRNILIALALSLLLLAPLAWLFARRLTRPFRALAGALGERTDPIPQEGPRELREAAAAIGTMRTTLAEEAAERARILTAIAHDLRTPLTSLRLRIEASPEPQRARMVDDVERMQAMIGEVLSFARDAAASNEIVLVRPLLAEIAAELTTDDAKVHLAPGDDVTIAVSALAFRRAVENLVRNAIDYAGSGVIEAKQVGDEVFVSVIDSGPGIPPQDRERLLKPFERGDASRNRETGGAGLGLSIVRDFAAQHQGKFTLKDADQGTAATLQLKAVPSTYRLL